MSFREIYGVIILVDGTWNLEAEIWLIGRICPSFGKFIVSKLEGLFDQFLVFH